MKISTAVVALHATILPSSLAYSPPQYRGIFSRRPVQSEVLKQKCAFHRPQRTSSTSQQQHGARLMRQTSLTALDVSSASPGEANGSANTIDVRLFSSIVVWSI